MSFIVEALATGPEGAVKMMWLRDDKPSATEGAEYSSRCSGAYRVEYGEWCAEVPKVSVTARG